MKKEKKGIRVQRIDRLNALLTSAALCALCWVFSFILHPEERTPFILASYLLLACLFIPIYLRMSGLRTLQQKLLLASILAATLLIALLWETLLMNSKSSLLQQMRTPLLAPLPTILIAILLSPRAALLSTPFLSLLLSAGDTPGRFFVMNLAASLTAALASLKGVRTRKAIFPIAAQSALAGLVALYAFAVSDGFFWSRAFFIDALSLALFLLISALLAISLLPVFESLFSVLTDSALMEYMNPNNKLLRRLTSEMPGTYQHSLALSHLAEAAARSIGANSLFCRVATLYHDIGKLNHPDFYSENQHPGMNIHQSLTPFESAQVILSHVPDGAALARKHRLPKAFIDIILEHHGTTVAYYFYRKAQEQSDEPIDPAPFRYPGPMPRTKESGIIMICDSVEAASHSLTQYNEEVFAKLVEQIVSQKVQEGQLDTCPLTLEELGKVKQSLISSLRLMHHTRVRYPARPAATV